MTYEDISKLPESLKKVLPEAGQKVFVEVYNESYSRDPSLAFATAWNIVKSKFQEVDGHIVANSSAFEVPKLYTFHLQEATTKIVMNSETEEVVLEAVLASTDPNTEGKFFTEEDLAVIDEQINMYGSTLPDVDHEHLKAIVRKVGNHPELIRAEIKKSKGVFKTIKSVLRDGKLWIQAFLDKRYKNHVGKFTQLSIEALADSDGSNRLKNPNYLGFSFTNNGKIGNARIDKLQ